MDIVIALDQGSSSSRALAFDSRGRVVARAGRPLRTFRPKEGWAEHDAAELARGQEKALDEVLARLPARADVAAIGIASQRSTVVLWDEKTGAPACRAPSWQDGRAAAFVAGLQPRQAEIHEKTGLYLTPFYSASKLRHIFEGRPELRAAAESGRLRAGPVSSYLLWRLTKGDSLLTEPSMAQRTLLFGLDAGDWDDSLLSLFGVPRACLPRVADTTGDFGVIERKGRRIPVRALIGDQQAAAFAQGGGVGSVALNYGTGAFFLADTGMERRRVPGLLTSVSWRPAGRPCGYFLEGTVHAAATALRWLSENLGIPAEVGKAREACRRSKRRILALQAIGGLGAPRWDYATPTVYLGLDARTRREDLIRATVESVAFFLSDIADTARGAGFAPGSVRASGGLAKLDPLLQFQADLLGSPVARLKEGEATATGAAALAAESAGLPWAGKLREAAVEKVFEPKMALEESARLKEGWRLFVETQRKLCAELRRLKVL